MSTTPAVEEALKERYATRTSCRVVPLEKAKVGIVWYSTPVES